MSYYYYYYYYYYYCYAGGGTRRMYADCLTSDHRACTFLGISLLLLSFIIERRISTDTDWMCVLFFGWMPTGNILERTVI